MPTHTLHVSTAKLSSKGMKNTFKFYAVMHGVIKLHKICENIININGNKLRRSRLNFCVRLCANSFCLVIRSDLISTFTGELIQFIVQALLCNFGLVYTHIIIFFLSSGRTLLAFPSRLQFTSEKLRVESIQTQ
jgi:hypothetical protein